MKNIATALLALSLVAGTAGAFAAAPTVKTTAMPAAKTAPAVKAPAKKAEKKATKKVVAKKAAKKEVAPVKKASK